MNDQFGPYIGDYRRWLWGEIQNGVSLDVLTKDAAPYFANVVATARRREARIRQQMKAITGPGPDGRNVREV